MARRGSGAGASIGRPEAALDTVRISTAPTGHTGPPSREPSCKGLGLAALDSAISNAWGYRASGMDARSIPVSPDFFHPSAWNQWLWEEDPMEEASASVALNKVHLLGLLIARFRATYQDRHHSCCMTVEDAMLHNLERQGGEDGQQNRTHVLQGARTQLSHRRSVTGHPDDSDLRMRRMQARRRMCVVAGVPMKDLTLRQLLDSVKNIQHEWIPQRVAETMQQQIVSVVDALFHRWVVSKTHMARPLKRTNACMHKAYMHMNIFYRECA
jgi:hypothetical protein